jgi:hypothetical protein
MKTWRLFGSFVRPYWWRLALALLVSVAGAVTDLTRLAHSMNRTNPLFRHLADEWGREILDHLSGTYVWLVVRDTLVPRRPTPQ